MRVSISDSEMNKTNNSQSRLLQKEPVVAFIGKERERERLTVAGMPPGVQLLDSFAQPLQAYPIL